MKVTVCLIVLSVCLSGCGSLNPQQAGTKPVSHAQFSELLEKYVDDQGLVDYEGLASEIPKLKSYLELLSNNAPNDSNWSDSDKMAYWINVYNAFTIELVLRHYPVESIKDIGSVINIPFVSSPWDIKFIEIAGKKYDLNNIEHNILRKLWDEPRIHFAVNCASLSCPKLMQEAFEGEKLDRQLDERARSFINDDFRNAISENEASISKIFSWYEGDFTKHMSLKEYINQYSRVKIDEETPIRYKDYDWALNVQRD